jgi:hypothetical protein
MADTGAIDLPELAADVEDVPEPVLDGERPIEEAFSYQDDTVPGLPVRTFPSP